MDSSIVEAKGTRQNNSDAFQKKQRVLFISEVVINVVAMFDCVSWWMQWECRCARYDDFLNHGTNGTTAAHFPVPKHPSRQATQFACHPAL